MKRKFMGHSGGSILEHRADANLQFGRGSIADRPHAYRFSLSTNCSVTAPPPLQGPTYVPTNQNPSFCLYHLRRDLWTIHGAEESSGVNSSPAGAVLKSCQNFSEENQSINSILKRDWIPWEANLQGFQRWGFWTLKEFSLIKSSPLTAQLMGGVNSTGHFSPMNGS